MAGASISVKILDAEAVAALRQIERLMGDTTPVTRAIGVGLVEVVHTHFETESDPQGKAWAPLEATYAANKRGAGILREAGMRGGLMGSITSRASASGVEVGSNKVYAGVHQEGATITPVNGPFLVFRLGDRVVHARSVTIPARPFIGVGPHEERVILETILDALDRAVARAAHA
ncbi:phage virion morphogenesis protein [Segnochrobactrum spirostomi]|uniref:Phage virion morphogenesis protein n=1 Tax=Segnochrobactrum spirostomi TaxID=2608987 RepID=A0A6A7Y6G1_9HYPH|nr:phage virion morphogenesis protein [Segnochrobactrum spirostomi]MQT14396.1 phage virion morphogenesis protein [Segnochrobactrum spirostomi]